MQCENVSHSQSVWVKGGESLGQENLGWESGNGREGGEKIGCEGDIVLAIFTSDGYGAAGLSRQDKWLTYFLCLAMRVYVWKHLCVYIYM